MTQLYSGPPRGLPARAAVLFTRWLAGVLVVLGLLATAGAAHAQTPATFAAVASYGSGGNQPISVAVADVNGDGKPDLLTTNLNSNVGVLLGTGAGSFGAVTTYDTGGSTPVYVAVADVNGDGKLDLLTANYFSNNVGVLLGTGTGGFGTATTYGTGGNNPNTVVVADVNGDGKSDLLTTNHSSDNVGVLLGTGTGSFGAATTYGSGAGSQPASIAVADVNGDGRPDLLTANYGSSTVGVLLGTGTGSFGTVTTYGSGGNIPNSIAVADVNGDGKLDLLTANQGSSTVGVLLGTGSFGNVTTYGSGAGSKPASVAVADVNGDGKPDLLTANSGSNTAGVLLGIGTGSFGNVTTYSTGAGSQPSSIAVADVNGDGKPDLLTANRGTDNVGVLLNTTVYAPTLTSLSPTSGPVGTSVTLTGTNLSRATGISFNGTAATTFAVVNSTTVTATVPTGATSGNVSVTTPDGTSNGLAFVVRTAPVAANDSYSTPYNTALTITPASLLANDKGDAGRTLTVGNTTPPAHGTLTQDASGNYVYAPTAGYSGADSFTYQACDDGSPSLCSNPATVSISVALPVPAISSFAPASGPVGTQVTLTGLGFGGATAVAFNGTAASSFTINSATQLTATVAAGTSSGPITVTTPGGTATSAQPFTVTPPLAVVSTSPVRNASAAPRAANVALTYNRAVDVSVAASVQVYAQQAGGRKAATATASGNTVTLDPAQDFKPGETVFVTSPRGAAAIPYVYQFTAQASPGPGTFSGGSDLAVGNSPGSVAVGDVDGDGDVDLVVANANYYNGSNNGTVNVRLNGGDASGSNTGMFSNGTTVTVGNHPLRVVLSDVDSDGDLDILTANADSYTGYGTDYGTVSVRLNGGDNQGGGKGVFSGGDDYSVGSYPIGIAVGDVDGDGDLDLLTASSGGTTISVRLNGGDNLGGGTGEFYNGSDPAVGTGPQIVAVGDVDGDGDLDLVATNQDNTISVRLNGGDNKGGGTGVFSGGSTLTISGAGNLTLGDVDGDGDLDLVVASGSANTVSVRLNGGDNRGGGTGLFSGGSNLAVSGAGTLALGDVDGDGDLDLLVPSGNTNTISVRLNGGDNKGGGTGVFSGGSDPAVGTNPASVAVGDLDGDGDLDLVVANYNNGNSGTVSVRLNQVPAPALNSFTPDNGATGTSVAITGTGFNGATGVTFNGTAVPGFVVNADGTSIKVSVPAGATTGPIRVTTPGGTATSGTPFTVRTAPVATADAYPTMQGQTLVVPASGVLANDRSPDGLPLAATLGSPPTHGTLTLNPDGSFSYTPAAGYSGSDSFTYQACDSGSPSLCSNVATVMLTVQPPACQAPTNVAVSQVNFTSATVSFTASPSASGGYVVSYTPSGGMAKTVTATASPVNLTGLTPNTTYSVTVASQCGGGLTATSAPPVSFMTPLRRVPENPSGTTAGLMYQYYEAQGANFTSLPNFASLTPKQTGTTAGFDERSLRQRSYGYAVRFTGYVTVPTDGDYTFFTNSDDGSQLFIGDQLVVDNDGNHDGRERAGTIGLQAGTHALTVTYYQDGGGDQLSVSYQGPGVAKQPIPGASLRVVLPSALRTPENPSGTTAGLMYQYYEAAANTSYTSLPTFASSTPKQSGATATIDERSLRQRNYGYALRFTGYVTVPTDGIYSFYTNSDDGSQLFIGSTLVVDNDGDHGTQERTGSIGLKAGTHAFTVTYYQDGGDDQLTVSYDGPGVSKQVIPAARFSYQSASPLRAPENPSGTMAGLRYQYYESATTYAQLPNFTTEAVRKSGTTTTFDERSLAQRSYGYALRYTGYVTVPTDGQYTFFTNSDDGSQLLIGSTLVVDNDGNHDVRERSGTIGLQAGTHLLTVAYYQDGGGDQLSVSYQGPGVSKQAIPAASLRYVPASAATSATSQLLAAAERASGLAPAAQAYPNPFTTEVTLTFALPQAGAYSLAVYDVTGRLVEQLPGGMTPAGEVQQVRWATAHYASGLYLVRLSSTAGTQQLRLVKQ